MGEEKILQRMKFILRESEMPMFSDEDLLSAYEAADSLEMALYELLILKSENTALEVAGLTIGDTSSYFQRLAATYRPHNSGILGG